MTKSDENSQDEHPSPIAFREVVTPVGPAGELRLGTAFEQGDGTLLVCLDGLPLNGRLVIKAEPHRLDAGRAERGETHAQGGEGP